MNAFTFVSQSICDVHSSHVTLFSAYVGFIPRPGWNEGSLFSSASNKPKRVLTHIFNAQRVLTHIFNAQRVLTHIFNALYSSGRAMTL